MTDVNVINLKEDVALGKGSLRRLMISVCINVDKIRMIVVSHFVINMKVKTCSYSI